MSDLPTFLDLFDNPNKKPTIKKWLDGGHIEEVEKFINAENDHVLKMAFASWKAKKDQERVETPPIPPRRLKNPPVHKAQAFRPTPPNNEGHPAKARPPPQQFPQAPPPDHFQHPSHQRPPTPPNNGGHPAKARPPPQQFTQVPPPDHFQHPSHQRPSPFSLPKRFNQPQPPPPHYQNGFPSTAPAPTKPPRQEDMTRNRLNQEQVAEYMAKTLKDTNLTWIFTFHKDVAGLVLGTEYANVNRYSKDYNVDLRKIREMGESVTFKIDGSGTSLDNVHTVCMDIWKRLKSSEHYKTRRASRELEDHLKNLEINKFQQLLFMEDFQIAMISQGSSWKFAAFSLDQLDKAEAMLWSITTLRQNEPVSLTDSLSSFSSTLTINSYHPDTPVDEPTNLTSVETVIQAPPKPKPRKIYWNNKKRVYNPQTFHTPKKAIFLDEDSIGHCLKKTTNILLLGQSGVGKSTFLNAFGNYLEFGNNFKKAEQNLKVYIPAQYDLAYDENTCESLTVMLKPSDGHDDGNEVFESGKSATQEARCYTFQYGSGANQKEVRIIDTPGLVDTEGMEKDQVNIARILKCIKQFPTLQAIVFLLRHDETRAMASLKYNLSELLKRLHHDAAKNILFVFPKTDPQQPPTTIKVLNEFFVKINANSKVKIIMHPKTTVFRLDNFGFLYLGGRKYGNYQEMGQIRQKAMECWNNSAKDVKNLLKAISALPDYPIQNTLEIQDTKICLEAFARPMADLSRQILNNQMKLIEKEAEINQFLKENKSLVGRLNCDQTIYGRRPIDTPRLCCYSDSCSSVFSASDHLPRICHDSCNCIPEDDKDQEAGKALLACVKFDKLSGRCTTCNCGLNTHRMVNFDLYESTRTVVSEAVTDTAKPNQTEREKAVKKCAELRSKNLILEKSLDKLRMNGAMFAAFIKLNSLHGDYDDSFEQHLKQCIQVAKNSNDEKTLENLEKFKERYNQEKELFNLAQSPESSITYKEIKGKLQELEQDEGIGHQVQEYTKMIGIYTDEDVPEEKKAIINSIFDRRC